MDLSQLSDEDLKRLYNNDYSKISDDAKNVLKTQAEQKQQEQAPPEPAPAMGQGPVAPDQSMMDQAGNFIMDNIVAPGVGAAQTAGQFAAQHPVAAGLAAAGAATALSKVPYVGPALQKTAGAFVPQPIKTIASAIPEGMANWAKGIESADAKSLTSINNQIKNLMVANKEVPENLKAAQQYFQSKLKIPTATGAPPSAAGQQAFSQMGQQLAGAPKPVAPVAPVAPTPSAQPGMIQRGMDLAGQVRQAAAQRIMPAMGQAGQAMSQAGSMFGKGLTAAAPALRIGGMASNALYSGDLNSGDQAELERRRKMQPTITR